MKQGKLSIFFFNFICEELYHSVSQNLRGFIDGSNLAGSQCDTSPRNCHNFCGLSQMSWISDLACMKTLLDWWTF